MPINRAVTAFKENRLNCAQSVLHAFQQHRNVSEEDIAQARRLGNGRAEDGLCGALYAALELVRDPSARDSLRSAFVAEAGSDKCDDISIPCVECVRLAASLLAESENSNTERAL
jgi:hypothetical protein